MAKQSVIMRNRKRKILSDRMKEARTALKNLIKSDSDERDDAVLKLQKRRRDECSSLVRERCRTCGRTNGTLKKFALCRIHLREAVMRGDVPGMKKASW